MVKGKADILNGLESEVLSSVARPLFLIELLIKERKINY